MSHDDGTNDDIQTQPDGAAHEAPEPPAGWAPHPNQQPNFGEPGSPDAQKDDAAGQGQQQLAPLQFPQQAPGQVQGGAFGPNVPMPDPDDMLLLSARRYVTASQIMALVSLFFGGIALSIASIAVAVMGMNRLRALSQKKQLDRAAEQMMVRPATIALGMCILALVLNVVSFALVYPLVMEMVETGDFSALLPGAGTSTPSPSPGESLFG